MNRSAPILLMVVLFCSSWAQVARADSIGIELVGLLGTGVDTGDVDNNPYALQLGFAADLIAAGYVIGFRYTRSVGTNADCVGPNCRTVDDLRTIGADLGWDWQLAKILHLSPRFGVGQVRERGDDGLRAPYIEPGGVAEVQIAIVVVGVDLRYRVAIKDSVANGFLAHARFGLRF